MNEYEFSNPKEKYFSLNRNQNKNSLTFELLNIQLLSAVKSVDSCYS